MAQLGIYEVVQDVERLSGEYFVRAVVAAKEIADAIQCVIDEVAAQREQWENDGLEPPFIDPTRTAARHIGTALDARPHEIFAIVYGSDNRVP